jgi:hypothetical protein
MRRAALTGMRREAPKGQRNESPLKEQVSCWQEGRGSPIGGREDRVSIGERGESRLEGDMGRDASKGEKRQPATWPDRGIRPTGTKTFASRATNKLRDERRTTNSSLRSQAIVLGLTTSLTGSTKITYQLPPRDATATPSPEQQKFDALNHLQGGIVDGLFPHSYQERDPRHQGNQVSHHHKHQQRLGFLGPTGLNDSAAA